MKKVTRLNSYRVNKITKEDKHEMYGQALDRLTERIITSKTNTKNAQDNFTKVTYLAMQYINTMPKDYNGKKLRDLEGVMILARQMLKLMTYETVKINFPIEKRYAKQDLDRKDYYYTVNEFKDWDEYELIGERVDDLLWDYQNKLIFKFHVNSTVLMSARMRIEGKQGLMEKFAQEHQIPFYTEQPDGTYKANYQKPNLTLIENE